MKNWLDDVQRLPLPLSQAQQDWIAYPGSMTACMQAACDNVEIIVYRQCSLPLLPSEAQLFSQCDTDIKMNLPSTLLAREIMMLCDGTPWLYARTVIPAQTLKLFEQVAELGTRAIGSILFSDVEIQRQAFSFASLDTDSDTLQAATVNTEFEHSPYIARRSLFIKQQQPLQLTEIFLPAMLEAITNQAISPVKNLNINCS